MNNSQASTPQYLSVTALTKYIANKFHRDPYLDRVFVKGEISNYNPRRTGHQYFTIKDDQSQLRAVMFAREFSQVKFQVEEGMEVLVTGKLTVYEPQGNYQMIVSAMEPDGIGALYLALEQLKAKMQAQGLFDRPKRPIPVFPKKIAVVTSPSGSVIQDIITTIRRRYPVVDITIFPTRVQGKEAAGEIVAAFNQIKLRADEYDTVIVARGGGSIEDLWPFNEEAVAHAILACPLPVISSIGHETDTTIADLVADLRAPTPTSAAEQAVPVLAEVLQYLQQLESRVQSSFKQRMQVYQKQLDSAMNKYIFRHPESIYQAYSQQVDQANQRLTSATDSYVKNRQYQANMLQQALLAQEPSQLVRQKSRDYQQVAQGLNHWMTYYLQRRQDRMGRAVSLLDAYSPLKQIARGYALVEHEGEIVKSVDQLNVGDDLAVQLLDGQVEAQVTQINQVSLIESQGEE